MTIKYYVSFTFFVSEKYKCNLFYGIIAIFFKIGNKTLNS